MADQVCFSTSFHNKYEFSVLYMKIRHFIAAEQKKNHHRIPHTTGVYRECILIQKLFIQVSTVQNTKKNSVF